MRRIGLWVIGFLAALSALAGGTVHGQSTNESAPQATAFPDADVYRVQIYGDDMAAGLVGGLAEALASEPRVQVLRRHRAIPGVFRSNLEEESKAIEAEIARDPIHVAVFAFGLADRVPIRAAGTGAQLAVGTDPWRAEYGRRIDRMTRLFRTNGIAVYWIGLPIMRRPDFNDHAQMMDGVMRERALANAVRFVDVLTSFADVDGKYDSYGPDVSGKRSLLRDPDGVHFTPAGYRKLAHFVERELKRDMAQSRNERAVPLAGSEEEQKRIRPLRAAAATRAGATRPAIPGAASGAGGSGARTSAQEQAAGTGDVRADNSRVTIKTGEANGREETATLEILRPAIPATVVALVTRRESSERASFVGDPVMIEIGGGVTVVNSITPSREGPAGRQRQAPVNSLYFKVLIKGERLDPKPGRSDDMVWPRQEVLPAGTVIPPVPQARPEPAASSDGPVAAAPAPQVRPAPVRAAPAKPKWNPFSFWGQ